MIKLRRFVSGFGLAAAALCAAGLWASGCVSTGSSGGGDAGVSPDGGNGNTTSTHSNMQIPAAISIKGLIKNDQDVPVANAEITVGTVMSASSDTDGVFDVDTAPTSDSVILKISAPDHAPQVVKVPLKARVANYAVPVVMKRVQSLSIPMGTTDTQIQIGSSPATVSFDGPMGGAATLRFVSMDATEGPGDLRFVDASAEEGVQSSGMLWVELTDDAGQAIPMPGGKVTMNVDTTETVLGAQTWQSMSMDANQGEWTPEG
ncbi:MAG TPA: hypothetical protein VL137_04765, partial [Polyangiaceae bacterium]|nr:hypothetical protein [Polyangiaceae bacterium]